MNKKQTVVASVVAMGLMGAAAWAGSKTTNWAVTIDTANSTAYGTFSVARSSADTVQYINCSAYGYDDGTSFASCAARSASGGYGSCSSTVASVVETVRSMPNDANVRFQWDASGNCTYVSFTNGSYYAPKQP